LPCVPFYEQELVLGDENLPTLRSWAARPGEVLTALDPEGGYWRLRLTRLDAVICGVPFARLEKPPESCLDIEVFQALPEKERFELVLQKLTELGVSRIVPVETERSTTQLQRDSGQIKSHRWPAVIQRAAKQCRRARLPELFSTMLFAEALQLAAPAELKLLLCEGAGPQTFSAALDRSSPQKVAMMVGPEGGFTAHEVVAAQMAGFLPVSLGPRIMRTETAAIVGTALLQALLGDLC
jgi:16S rRNA (uracil1498-N3)-methyltransferase